MKTTSIVMLLSMIALTWVLNSRQVYAQNNRVEWSAFGSGFGVPSFLNTVAKSSVGQAFTGRSQLGNNVVESGFLANRLLRGLLVSVHEEEPLPMVFALYQNFPNPFNPSTNIKYQIPASPAGGPSTGWVTLKVFDILGREVVTLVNEQQDAGYKTVQWNASDVASGVYFYRLEAESFVNVKKLLLLK